MKDLIILRELGIKILNGNHQKKIQLILKYVIVKEKTKKGLREKIKNYIYKDDEGNEILKKYKVVQLFVGYDFKQDDTINYCMRSLDNSVALFKGNEILFNPDE